MIVSRRQLLKAIPATCAGLMFPKVTAAFAADMVSDAAGRRRMLLVGSVSKVCIIDAETMHLTKEIELGFRPHSFIPHPTDPNRLWAIQRHKTYFGPEVYEPIPMYAAEFDVASGKMTQRVLSSTTSEFRGHGFILPPGDIIFVSRVDLQTGQGHLTGYDTKSGKQVADYMVTPGGIHDTHLLDDGTVLVASSGTSFRIDAQGKPVHESVAKSGIIHFDLKQGRELNTMFIESNQGITHFHLMKDGMIVALATSEAKSSHPGEIYMGKMGDSILQPVTWKVKHRQVYSEMFSIDVNEKTGVAVIANYDENAVFKLDLKTRTIVKKIDSYYPFGLAFNDSLDQFIVTSGTDIGVYDENLKSIKQVSMRNNGIRMDFTKEHSYIL